MGCQSVLPAPAHRRSLGVGKGERAWGLPARNSADRARGGQFAHRLVGGIRQHQVAGRCQCECRRGCKQCIGGRTILVAGALRSAGYHAEHTFRCGRWRGCVFAVTAAAGHGQKGEAQCDHKPGTDGWGLS